VSLSIWLCTL